MIGSKRSTQSSFDYIAVLNLTRALSSNMNAYFLIALMVLSIQALELEQFSLGYPYSDLGFDSLDWETKGSM